MISRDEIKQRVQLEIDKHSDELVRIAKIILDNPEPGYREVKTANLVADKLGELGIPFQDKIGITGIKGMMDTGRDGPTVAVMGELDSMKVHGHPHADPLSEAAHACGHHCQIAMMLGVAMALKPDSVKETLSGRIALMAVPAEEYIEIEYRDTLRRQGKIEFLGGKQEFISRGALDDVDIAMMTHTAS